MVDLTPERWDVEIPLWKMIRSCSSRHQLNTLLGNHLGKLEYFTKLNCSAIWDDSPH